MASIEDIKALGYDVEIEMELDDDLTVYRVTGHGLNTQVRSDDPEAIDSLADRELHEERLAADEPS